MGALIFNELLTEAKMQIVDTGHEYKLLVVNQNAGDTCVYAFDLHDVQ